MNPYQEFVRAFVRLADEGKKLPLGKIQPPKNIRPNLKASVAMIFSPHPDDECIIGGLALRLAREAGMRVINVAVTLGSKEERRAARRQELKKACDWLNFELEQTGPGGLEKINSRMRRSDPKHWSRAVKIIAASIMKNRPRVIFFPHKLDWNVTHIGTHFLVMDALRTLPPDFQTRLVETEFWGQMPSPNLMVESGATDVADLLAALSFHVGEVRRNPYHLRLPSWMQDNVRRGAELVGGQGRAAPDFTFATLYRVRHWKNNRAIKFFPGGRQIGAGDNPVSCLK
jgi:N-acetylglucosamine malate deacetylase 1